jgi:hypothetical protein
MAYHHEKVKTALVRRTTELLLLHGWPRFWMSLSIAVTLYAWWRFCTVLAGVPNFAVRYGLCAAGSYLAWLVFTAAWLRLQRPIESSTFKEQARVPQGTFDWQYAEWRRNRDDFFRQTGDEAAKEMLRDPLGGIGALVAVAALGGPIVGLWLVSFSPQFFAQLLVESGRVKHSTSYAPQPMRWYEAVLKRTGWFALALVLHYAALAGLVQWFHPDASGICAALQPPVERRAVWE